MLPFRQSVDGILKPASLPRIIVSPGVSRCIAHEIRKSEDYAALKTDKACCEVVNAEYIGIFLLGMYLGFLPKKSEVL